MYNIQIVQGEDRYVTFNLRDKSTNTIVDLSTVVNIVVKLVASRAELIKYSLLTQVGFLPITLDLLTNEITIRLDRTNTGLFPIGAIDMSVVTSEVDTITVDEKIHREYIFSNYILVTEGYGKTELI